MNFARRLSTLKIKVNVENGDEKMSLDKQRQPPYRFTPLAVANDVYSALKKTL